MKKLYDLTVVTGTYEKNGETKRRYMQIGSMMESDDGKPFILLDPLVNLAAVPKQEGRDRVMVSCFEPKDDDRKTGVGSKSKPVYGDEEYNAIMGKTPDRSSKPLEPDLDIPF